eukprot:CAMPEP_0201545080 /NCGR_PEP_ID=MMETSP0173_2-20130828/1636_1 /ASSEMBLY_ACC=CAM_ASM_000268 /TAXON_ID=218659 /ORGANISM="Vexillifera sp., Strain DIVA3 564/2" /LENGTH=402 /DNA_ID=CAMNT_0047953389 /DNA_START=811 /DNA_END=2019 /DNA_ORIENTATION=-
MSVVSFDDSLISVCIIERDNNDDILIPWYYPSLSNDLEQFITNHCGLVSSSKQAEAPLKFTYNNFDNTWVYIWTRFVQQEENNDERVNTTVVKAFSICLCSSAFQPEKYAALCELLSSTYAKRNWSPLVVLQGFLSVFRKNKISTHFDGLKFDGRRSLLATSIKDLIRAFGDHTILLWTALMMKKRIAVFSERLVTLLRLIRGFPLFVWHRQDWNILRPHVSIDSDLEMKQLQNAGVFCAGFTDPAIKARSNQWDVLVDVNARTVRVADHAKAEFELCAWQTNFLKFLLEQAEDPNTTPQSVIKSVALKTKELLTKLSSLRVKDPSTGNLYVTQEALHSVKLPPKMDKFLYTIAAAEGLTKETAASSRTKQQPDQIDDPISSSSSSSSSIQQQQQQQDQIDD